MKLKYKAPANGGHLVYCPYCGKKMERYKETSVKYCLDCQRGFCIYSGSSTGTIGTYQLTDVEMVAGKMERIERDD
jgi:hypothetical protein